MGKGIRRKGMNKESFRKEVVTFEDEKGRVIRFAELKVYRNENEFKSLEKVIAKNNELIKQEQDEVIKVQKVIESEIAEKVKAENYRKHFSKKHFTIAYEHLRLSVIAGLVEISDSDGFVSLFDEVMSDIINVEIAVEKYAELKAVFSKIFGEWEN
jgi:hypothetical protein